MRSPNRFHVLALAVAFLGTVACGQDAAPVETPFAPSPPEPPAAAGRYALRVTNGVTNASVAAASIRLAGVTVVADATGRAEVPGSAACAPATVLAVGFLDRRLCLHTPSAGSTATVNLWPVENDAEREALKAFAFPGDQLVRRGFLQVDPPTGPSGDPAAVAAWQRAAQTIREATAGHFTAEIPVDVESAQDGTLVRPWTQVSDCVGTRTAWYALAGYCAARYTGGGSPYFISVVRVAPDRLADEAVALRVLLSEFRLAPHPGPGLMSERDPAATLSDFERRTLRMITLRDRPYPGSITWPDDER